jgi:hypothetical protein
MTLLTTQGGALILAVVLLSGCQWNERAKGKASADDHRFAVRIDRCDNGAARAEMPADMSGKRAVPRTLSFEMMGTANLPKYGTTQEDRAATVQAAIIEAFCKALAEARQSRGQTASDFTAELGPRLTVSHCTVDGGEEIHVTVIDNGVETTFVTRDGKLQHPPRDMRLVHCIFEETNGEFSLLGTEWLPAGEECVATIGCYLPLGYESAVAMEADTDASAEADEAP